MIFHSSVHHPLLINSFPFLLPSIPLPTPISLLSTYHHVHQHLHRHPPSYLQPFPISSLTPSKSNESISDTSPIRPLENLKSNHPLPKMMLSRRYSKVKNRLYLRNQASQRPQTNLIRQRTSFHDATTRGLGTRKSYRHRQASFAALARHVAADDFHGGRTTALASRACRSPRLFRKGAPLLSQFPFPPFFPLFPPFFPFSFPSLFLSFSFPFPPSFPFLSMPLIYLIYLINRHQRNHMIHRSLDLWIFGSSQRKVLGFRKEKKRKEKKRKGKETIPTHLDSKGIQRFMGLSRGTHLPSTKTSISMNSEGNRIQINYRIQNTKDSPKQ